MTDIETLFIYRLQQAEETLLDAERMLKGNFTPRSITNRAYYSMFYAVLALFLKTGINVKTSKHVGVISLFDKEFIHTKKIDKRYSTILHKVFNVRLQGDYKELVKLSAEDAALNDTFEKSVRYRGRNIKNRDIIQFECHHIANGLIK